MELDKSRSRETTGSMVSLRLDFLLSLFTNLSLDLSYFPLLFGVSRSDDFVHPIITHAQNKYLLHASKLPSASVTLGHWHTKPNWSSTGEPL